MQGLGTGVDWQLLGEVRPQALEQPRVTHTEQGVAVSLVVEAGAQLTLQVPHAAPPVSIHIHAAIHAVFLFCFWS